MKFMSVLRKHIGTIIAVFGFFLLCVLTFGNLGDLITEEYWRNVKENLTSIGFLSISLTMIQVAIKQGIGEQALQRGLNTDKTAEKYLEHRDLIKTCTDRMIYLPYFLQIYNDRHTKLRRREFIVDNNFKSEEQLFQSGDRMKIRKYKKIRVSITATNIKWATTEIVYDKNGRIVTLGEYRIKRTIRALIQSSLIMIGVTFLTRGLFFDGSNVPLWQKFVKLATYVISIAMSSIFSVIKEYEKGAFGVPNELEEINEIWTEFQNWNIPQEIVAEVERINALNLKEVLNEREESSDVRTDLQEEQTEGANLQEIRSDSVCSSNVTHSDILLAYDKE